MPANAAPQTMTIKGTDRTLQLTNILIGDVRLVGGQSNMEFDLSKVDEGQLEVVSANFSQIRLLTPPQGQGFEPVASFQRRSDKATRVGHLKWVESSRGSGLFDLSSDLGEQHDLSKERPDLLAKVKARFAAWEKLMAAAEPHRPFRDF